jgi:hypothetical protein
LTAIGQALQPIAQLRPEVDDPQSLALIQNAVVVGVQ